MKIGQFAEKFNISIDTVRHYMEMGLVVPLKKGGLYNFDLRCEKEMSLISEMKDFGFKLKEIRIYLFYSRLMSIDSKNNRDFYEEMLKVRSQEVDSEIEKLRLTQESIDIKRGELAQVPVKEVRKLGIPLDALDMFCCPKCHEKMKLSSTCIEENSILDGNLTCSCGTKYIILDGMMVDSTIYENFPNEKRVDSKVYFGEYVDNIVPGYFEILYKATEWSKQYLDIQSGRDKVVLECGSYLGLVLRSYIESMNEDSMYICVEPYYPIMKLLKEIIEDAGLKKRVVFISTLYSQIPLKEETIDFLIDGNGTLNEILSGHVTETSSMLDYTAKLVKPGGRYLGCYMIFEKFDQKHHYIPENLRYRFNEKYVKEYVSGYDFKPVVDRKFSYFPYAGEYDEFYVEGDKLYPWLRIEQKMDQ